MRLARREFALALAFASLSTTALRAQEHGEKTDHISATGDSVNTHGEHGPVDIITPHITDSYTLDVPSFSAPFVKEVCIGRHNEGGECALPLWDDAFVAHIAGMPLEFNFSPTKHVVMLLLAATLCLLMMMIAASAHAKHTAASGRPRGLANAIEAVVLYIRNEVVIPNVGPHGEHFAPFVLTLFFFILFANLLGLIPYGSTATGNISVTATLAIITFVVVEIAGMRALGSKYIGTIVYWPHGGNPIGKLLLSIIMTPVELLGKFTKPFALAIRLFANMTAGHVVVLALISLIFTFGSYLIGIGPLAMAVGIMVLELFVAFLQAFVFSLLTSVFIGQIRSAHH